MKRTSKSLRASLWTKARRARPTDPHSDEPNRIDIGLDLGSYALQAEALDKLYYDPARQRERNAVETLAVQEAHVLDPAAKAHVREWTLQGTELREDLVPPVASPGAAEEPALAPETDSGLFRENQLINSWVERYRRDDPLVLPGDPDLGLNASQTKAIAIALGDRLSLIQGVSPGCLELACLPARPLIDPSLPLSPPAPANRRRSSRSSPSSSCTSASPTRSCSPRLRTSPSTTSSRSSSARA